MQIWACIIWIGKAPSDSGLELREVLQEKTNQIWMIKYVDYPILSSQVYDVIKNEESQLVILGSTNGERVVKQLKLMCDAFGKKLIITKQTDSKKLAEIIVEVHPCG